MIRRPILLILFLSVSLLMVDNAEAISRKAALAEKLYLEGDYRGASYECESLLRKYKSGEFRSEVAYLAGLSYLKLNNFTKSKEYFEFVLNNSKDSLLINEAQIGLASISKISPSIREPSLFSIQIGSFKNKRNAQRLYNRFKRKKYTVRITKEKSGRVVIYKVKIGKFKSRKDAVQFAKKLRRKGYPIAIVAY